MFKLLFLTLYSLGFSSLIQVDKAWDDRINLSSSKYQDMSESARRNELDNLQYILKNPDNLISKEFSIPSGLKDRVLFWAKIYALYPSSLSVIHDVDDLSLVYKVVNTNVANTEKGKIRIVLNKIQAAGGVKNFVPATPEEKRIRNLVRRRATPPGNLRVQEGQKDKIITGIQTSSRYLPLIEQIFKEDNLPWELTRIPFVESSFNIQASSKVGAKGVWQIIDTTGKKLMTTGLVYDERYSPFKAGAVAAKLLKENYSILHDWPLAITAYNHGPTGLKKASQKLKTKDIAKIISNYEGRNFGFASQNFYCEFLAALYVTVYSERLFGHLEKNPPLNFYYVYIEKDTYISKLSHVSGLSMADIVNYNHEFNKKILSGEVAIKAGTTIKLPPRASYKVDNYFVRISNR